MIIENYFESGMLICCTYLQVLRIDISTINTSSSDNGKAMLDSAMRVYFAPSSVRHLLVTTANNKLLKFDARTGRILAEVSILVDLGKFNF